MRRNDLVIGFVAGLMLSMLVGMLAFGFYSQKLLKYKQALATADSLAVRAGAARDEAIAHLAEVSLANDSAQALINTLQSRLARSVASLADAKRQLASLDAAVQRDSACWQLCRPSIAARDTLLAQVERQRDSAVAGLRVGEEALQESQVALAEARTTIAVQDSTIRAYQHATDLVPVKASFWKRLVPGVSIGGWAGQSMIDHEFDVGLGIGVGWELLP